LVGCNETEVHFYIFYIENKNKKKISTKVGCNAFYLIIKIFFGVPYSATFYFVIFVYLIASIAYIHPVYSAEVRTHDLLIISQMHFIFKNKKKWKIFSAESIGSGKLVQT
jgi:hypothetical protein